MQSFGGLFLKETGKLNIIGKPFTRADAAQKAAGAEKYAADWYGDNLLWAGVRRSGIAHGRIISVDPSEAMRLPGVFAVLTGQDIAGSNKQGMLHKDFPVLTCDKVRYCGDAVALMLDGESYRSGQKLDMASFKESGSIEYEASWLGILAAVQEGKNGGYDLKDNWEDIVSHDGNIDLIIFKAKGGTGTTGRVPLKLNIKKMTFTDRTDGKTSVYAGKKSHQKTKISGGLYE